MSDPAAVTVQDNPEKDRYEAVDESGVVAGFAAYRKQNGSVVFTHTEVDDAFEGRGVGSTLAREALDDVRGSGVKVVAQCPFIKSYIDRHPDYQDLLA